MINVNNNASVNSVLTMHGVDKAGMDLETIITLVLSEKQQIFEGQVQSLVQNMQVKNQKLKELGEIQALVTSRQKELPPGADSHTVINRYDNDGGNGAPSWEARRNELRALNSGTEANLSADYFETARNHINNSTTWSEAQKARGLEDLKLAEAARNYGVNTGERGDPAAFAVNDCTSGSLEALAAKIKAETDALGNESQMDQIALQSAMNKMQNTSQLLSTVIKKFDDLKGTIGRNI